MSLTHLLDNLLIDQFFTLIRGSALGTVAPDRPDVGSREAIGQHAEELGCLVGRSAQLRVSFLIIEVVLPELTEECILTTEQHIID